ncbi:hypothetical protein C8E00_101522 [Chromohalobacter marismortui]|uniref:Addiction module HigA family antidote n=1 Tax=Chromohalobacter marismortui TaxID=42055 RepID=A0A4R7NX72_9GAMM|nr:MULTISPECIES: hypothetical protein [Chromohalobacter]MCI0510296.1 hypothetical protein [Chromohalobacter sp.]MCI0593991.1 hypothetical protein [Chromohalobacter sp.]TDU25130.1 hypothetical protein C8E00_101522 [Chromohalobacter marismortui]
MAITAKQTPDRCPPHPGEVIEDMLEDMDYSKGDIAQMLAFHVSSCTPFSPHASLSHHKQPRGSASCLVTVRACGYGSRRPMTPGMPSAK